MTSDIDTFQKQTSDNDQISDNYHSNFDIEPESEPKIGEEILLKKQSFEQIT